MFISKKKKVNLQCRIMTLEAELREVRRNLDEAKILDMPRTNLNALEYIHWRRNLPEEKITLREAVNAIMEYLKIKLKKEPEQLIAVKIKKEIKNVNKKIVS